MRAVKPREYGSTHDVVIEAFKQAGGAKEVGALFDLGASQIYGFTDPAAKGSDLTLHRARQLTYVKKIDAFAVDFAGLAGGVFLSASVVETGEGLADVGADISQRVADVVSDLLKAVQDGTVSATECTEIRHSADLAIAAIVALRGRVTDGCKP